MMNRRISYIAASLSDPYSREYMNIVLIMVSMLLGNNENQQFTHDMQSFLSAAQTRFENHLDMLLLSTVYLSTVSQAYFALHNTLHFVQNFRKKIFFVSKVTSETFLSISQSLKVTRLQGCT
jgi:hypothetical protein